MPAGVIPGIVELIVDVPTEHAVTEPAELLHEGGELIHAHVLAADHAIDVRQTQLDLGDTFLAILSKFLG